MGITSITSCSSVLKEQKKLIIPSVYFHNIEGLVYKIHLQKMLN